MISALQEQKKKGGEEKIRLHHKRRKYLFLPQEVKKWFPESCGKSMSLKLHRTCVLMNQVPREKINVVMMPSNDSYLPPTSTQLKLASYTY